MLKKPNNMYRRNKIALVITVVFVIALLAVYVRFLAACHSYMEDSTDESKLESVLFYGPWLFAVAFTGCGLAAFLNMGVRRLISIAACVLTCFLTISVIDLKAILLASIPGVLMICCLLAAVFDKRPYQFISDATIHIISAISLGITKWKKARQERRRPAPRSGTPHYTVTADEELLDGLLRQIHAVIKKNYALEYNGHPSLYPNAIDDAFRVLDDADSRYRDKYERPLPGPIYDRCVDEINKIKTDSAYRSRIVNDPYI